MWFVRFARRRRRLEGRKLVFAVPAAGRGRDILCPHVVPLREPVPTFFHLLSMKLSFRLSFAFLCLSSFVTVRACDLCGCYLPSQEKNAVPSRFGFFAGVSEQFTHFGTLQFNDAEVANPAHQYLDSSITQFVLGTSFLDGRLALQADVPLIYRSFSRPEGFETDRGHVQGLGDVSFLLNWSVFRTGTPVVTPSPASLSKDAKSVPPVVVEPAFASALNLFAGLKLPTGDSSRLKEEFHEEEVEGAPESAIHGHDLALGTGSWDGVFGAQLFLRYQRAFFQADTQFTLRGDSHYSYHFANDLSWSGGPGVYLFRRERSVLGLQCVLSGESKDTDRFQGRVAEDTGVTSLYVGPRITGQLGNFSADVGIDLPVLMNTTKFQAVPDYRIRAGLTWHF